MNMDQLLASYVEDFGLKDDDDIDGDSSAMIAQEVNILKQQSEQQMEEALHSEKSLQRDESIDNYMPNDNCVAIIDSIIEKKKLEIAAIPRSDPKYTQKVRDIEKRAKQTKYKAMKSLNTQNERVPHGVKANMVRRASINSPMLPKLKQ